MSQTILSLLVNATFETIYMVVLASIAATLVGLPLGITLYVSRKGNILEHFWIYQILSMLVNMTRSIPFIILMIAVIPFTRFVVGSSIGTNAAIVPLSLCAMPFIARVVENALLEINTGLIEAAQAMGATSWHIITKVLIPESLPSMINGLTLTIVNLVGYSAMAGAVGGGGIGDVAIRYGYQRFMPYYDDYHYYMIVLAQIIQLIGDGIGNIFMR